MLKLDLYVKVMLTLIAVAAIGLLVQRVSDDDFSILPVAHAGDVGKLNYAKDGGVAVACSTDGKYVYVAGTEGVIRSDDYGRLGSWEKTLKED